MEDGRTYCGTDVCGEYAEMGGLHCVNCARKNGPVGEVGKLLTLILSTSPIESHPSTDLILDTVRSLSLLRGLEDIRARTIICCDGLKIHHTSHPRKGQCTEDLAERYEVFKERLRRLAKDAGSPAPLRSAEVLALERRRGFGMALREAMLEVRTPYVMVVQHDRRFHQGFDVKAVMSAMIEYRSWLHYVHFPTSSTLNHCEKVMSKYHIRLDPLIRDDPSRQQRFVPLIQWYDSSHICPTDHYLNFVYDKRAGRVSNGGFIEDRMGPIQLKDIRENGISAHAKYGTFALYLNEDPRSADNWLVEHVDGRDDMVAQKLAHTTDIVNATPGKTKKLSTRRVVQIGQGSSQD